jgi:CDP-diacylglycerol--glycerol-3-phosphate 3-phosphatidyltransferase
VERDEYLARWGELHGMDPRSNGVVRWWLGLVHAMATPFVRVGASPDAVTLVGLGVSLLALPCAWLGGHWLVGAAIAVFASGITDNLDGAVAVMTGRATRWGAVLDSACDRIGDMVFLVALWLAGAPAAACVAAAGLTFLQEYVRARAAAGGMSEVGVVSVWERPSRVLVVGMFLLAAGLHPGWAGWLLSTAAWASFGLAVVGLVQVTVTVRRRLLRPPS